MTEHHPPTPPSAFVRLGTFENELEARRVESELRSILDRLKARTRGGS